MRRTASRGHEHLVELERKRTIILSDLGQGYFEVNFLVRNRDPE